ncbi:hypothetical protein GGR54DRAFT_642311 [Hypoxylon sp. NC1633]|nr:hypothetical protein GGR54DRAFT_642311 [Hypoxylon sp. NC1633]
MPERRTDALTKLLLSSKDTATPTSQGSTSGSISHWHLHASETTLAVNESVESSDLSPAPLKIPADGAPSPVITVLSDSSEIHPCEYAFPLPPTHSSGHSAGPRSPFPPPHSISTLSPSLLAEPTRRKYEKGIPKGSIQATRHIRSSTGIRSPTRSKPLPARPSIEVGKEEVDEKGSRSYSPGGSVLSKGSLPPSLAPETEDQVNNRPNERECQTIMIQYSRGGSAAETNVPTTPPQLEDKSHERIQRLTPEQMIWLHRNYRGEATFLKAWGLHITRDEDRKEGFGIMRELMAAESPMETERLKQKERQKKRSQHGRLQFTPSMPAPREKESLHVIEEKVKDYEFCLNPTSGSLGLA